MLEAGKTADEIRAGIDLSQSRALLAGDDERAQRFFDRSQEEAIGQAIKESDGKD